MTLKKVLIIASALLGLGIHSHTTLAQQAPLPGLSILPESYAFLDVQEFDISIKLPYELHPQLFVANSPYKFRALINGNDATEWLRKCTDQYRTTTTGAFVLLCKKQNNSVFTLPENELIVSIEKDGTSFYEGRATYFVVPTQRYYHTLPHSLTLPGNSVNREPSLRLVAGQRVLITATGQVNTWPANPGFPIATPKGNSTTCNVAHCTLPGAPQGALLAKVGADGPWTVIGDNRVFSANRTGDLIFAINDKQTTADLNDNIGSYEITVKPY